MVYKEIGFKVIHFDGLSEVEKTDEYQGELILNPEVFEPLDFTLKIVLLWKYRISKEETRILSYVAQDTFILSFSKESIFPLKEVWELIDRSHLKYCIEWRRITMDSKIEGWEISMLSNESKSVTAREVITYANEWKLFR